MFVDEYGIKCIRFTKINKITKEIWSLMFKYSNEN